MAAAEDVTDVYHGARPTRGLLDNLGHPSATTILPAWTHPLMALFGVLLMEFGDFAMLRKMLRGIKQRAESMAYPALDTAARFDERPTA